MAVLKIVNQAKKYHDHMAYEDLVSYCTVSRKCPYHCISGRAVNPKNAALAMQSVARVYEKDQGVRLRHIILSFSPAELDKTCDADVDSANKIAWEIMGYYSRNYQILACVHTNKKHLHIHFIMNMVSYLDGKKYPGDKRDFYRFQSYVKAVLIPYGIRSLRIRTQKQRPSQST